ncbi:MAG: aldehyde dehydrogenase family protein [Acidobacteria bacterium]|nr:aldehyde dehydrogenase family protein [Acidobacteriota bacterium]
MVPADAPAEILERIASIRARQMLHAPAVAATGARERQQKLLQLEQAILARRQAIRDAVWADFRKPESEADISEILATLSEARHTRRHLAAWMRPRRAPATLAFFGSRAWIVPEPRGRVLIISPWNFPLMLSLGPLVSAVAAGNCVVLKPSELTPATAKLIREIVGEVFIEDEVAVIEGDARVSGALLSEPWNHIFFTGSTAVGRVVMRAAAEHLCPVTLELGGKSPAIVEAATDLDEAAKKIVWGKLSNGGQQCIAPDYVLVEKAAEATLIEKLQKEIAHRYAPESGGGAPIASIIDERHFRRISALIDDAVADGAEIVTTGERDARLRHLPPTVLRNVSSTSSIMMEEIFGPVLPVLTWEKLDDAIRFVNDRQPPLALYVFSRNERVVDAVLRGTRAGTTAINDVVIHFSHPNLPFGGFMESGFGRGHGKEGFETFSNLRSVLEQPRPFGPMALFYPPYTPSVRKLIDFALRWL